MIHNGQGIQSRIRYAPIHYWAVLGYGIVCGIGAHNPIVGFVCLALFALVGSLITIIKNLPILMLVMFIGAISVVFPPLGIIAFLFMVYLFIRRLSFLLHNLHLVLVGIANYALACGLFCFGAAMGPNISSFCIMAVIGGLVFHSSLAWANRKGYSTEQTIEIMSVIPLLLISFILPFLKLHFGADHLSPDTTFTHVPDTAPMVGAPVEAAALNSTAFHPVVTDMHPIPIDHAANALHMTSFGDIPHPFVMGSLYSSNHINGGNLIQSTTNQMEASMHHYAGNDLIQNHLGQVTGRVMHQGNTDIIQNNLNQVTGMLVHNGNTVEIQNHLGQITGRVVLQGNENVIENSAGQITGRIIHMS
jgi:hypothetical protein